MWQYVGPEGFRGEPGTSTQWPSGLTVAHTWDPQAFLQWGTAMGKEFYGKGANVQVTAVFAAAAGI